MKTTSAALLAAVLMLTGCGYKLGEIRPTPMRSVRDLSVPTFKNNTYEPRLEVMFADTLVKRLQQDGSYHIVNSDQADAILNCTITKIDRNALRSVQNNVLATSEFGLTVQVRYDVVDQKTGAILMSGVSVGRTSFFSGNDLQTIERQAMSNAAADLANNITGQISEGW
jgi:outer membrane lipopolysaccharide assembly protein LptE/RlpB